MSDGYKPVPRVRLGPLAQELAEAEANGEHITGVHLEIGLARLQASNQAVRETIRVTNKAVLMVTSAMLASLDADGPSLAKTELADIKAETMRLMRELDALAPKDLQPPPPMERMQ